MLDSKFNACEYSTHLNISQVPPTPFKKNKSYNLLKMQLCIVGLFVFGEVWILQFKKKHSFGTSNICSVGWYA